MSTTTQTKGKWMVSPKVPGTVISTEKVLNNNFPSPPNSKESREEEIGYYGGYLICESIGNDSDAKLIAGARRMFDTCVLVAARDGYQYVYDLIEEVTGQKWSMERMNKEALEIRKRSGLTL